MKESARAQLRYGGISAILLALSYLVITVLYVVSGAVPSDGGSAWLDYLSGKEAVWWAIVGLSVLTDLLFLPVLGALYVALKATYRPALVGGIALVLLFVILDLAVTWPNYSALIRLSTQEGADRIGAATYASSVLGSSLFSFYAVGVPALGILLISLVIRASGFSRAAGYTGVLTGILGAVSVISALGVAVIVTSVLTIVWVVLVGVRLLRS